MRQIQILPSLDRRTSRRPRPARLSMMKQASGAGFGVEDRHVGRDAVVSVGEGVAPVSTDGLRWKDRI